MTKWTVLLQDGDDVTVDVTAITDVGEFSWMARSTEYPNDSRVGYGETPVEAVMDTLNERASGMVAAVYDASYKNKHGAGVRLLWRKPKRKPEPYVIPVERGEDVLAQMDACAWVDKEARAIAQAAHDAGCEISFFDGQIVGDAHLRIDSARAPESLVARIRAYPDVQYQPDNPNWKTPQWFLHL